MAENNLIFARAVLFASLLLFSYGIRLSEGVRLFKMQKDEYWENRVRSTMSSHGIYGADHDGRSAFLGRKFTAYEYATKDVHPTSPGHSPSVGHAEPARN